MDTRRATLAGDPIHAIVRSNAQEELMEAAEAALGLLDRIDAHAPGGLSFGGEGRVRKQLRAAIRGARAEAGALAWVDAESAAEAEALDELRRDLGRAPSDGERRSFLAGFREARLEHSVRC